MNSTIRSETRAKTNINPIHQDELNKLKCELNKINPDKMINEALLITSNLNERRHNHSNGIKVNQDDETKTDMFVPKENLLELAKITSMQNYLESIKGKSIKEMIDDYQNKIDEYNRGVQVIIDKTKKENLQYITQYNSIKEKNTLLEEQINQMNIEHMKIEQQLKNSENQIYKLQVRFEIFNNYKELFDEFLKQFPDMKPIDIMKDLQVRGNESKQLLQELNEKNEKINLLMNEKNTLVKDMKKANEELSIKIYQLQKEKKEIVTQYEKDQIQLQNELSQYKDFKKENILLHNMLFQLYNLLFDTLRLDKGINVLIKEKYLNITKEDFNPNVFDNAEVVNYIRLMIKSMVPSVCENIYRECIAYANMMVRSYLPEKVNTRYQPLEIFKEIKSLVEKKENAIKKYQQDLALQSEKIKEQEKEIKMLKDKSRNQTLQYENYQKIVKKELDKKINNNDNNTNIPNTTGGIGMITDRSGNSKEDELTHRTGLIKDIQCNNDSNNNNNKVSTSNKPIAITTELKDIPIKHKKTNNNQIALTTTTTAKQKMYSDHLLKKNLMKSSNYFHQYEMDNNIQTTSSKMINKPKKKDKVIITSKQKKKDTHINNDVNISFNSESDGSSQINEEEVKEFRQLRKGKNNDKLIKSHGCQEFISNLNGIKELVEHTNRMFLYKPKMKMLKDPQQKDRFEITIENRFINKNNDKTKIETYNPFKERALGKINHLLAKIEAQDN